MTGQLWRRNDSGSRPRNINSFHLACLLDRRLRLRRNLGEVLLRGLHVVRATCISSRQTIHQVSLPALQGYPHERKRRGGSSGIELILGLRHEVVDVDLVAVGLPRLRAITPYAGGDRMLACGGLVRGPAGWGRRRRSGSLGTAASAQGFLSWTETGTETGPGPGRAPPIHRVMAWLNSSIIRSVPLVLVFCEKSCFSAFSPMQS